tara:strand:- start:3097 stop:3885 length:789 start_codon:yes stop_codon:yes gene_type:complete
MHYFQFNIGDYASHTSRLTPLEDLAYRRMLDLYYLNEQPLNGCLTDVARELGLSEHVNEVKYVLSKFFTETETGFSQKRIDLEIKKYKSNAKNKSKAGKASAKARATKASKEVTGVEQVLNTSLTNVEQNINQEPITNNHKPITNKDTLSTKADNALEIFNHWKLVMKKSNNSLLNDKRTKAINARLKEGYTVDQIKMAITGCSMTPHNMGQNDNNKKYDDLELICRDGVQVERFGNNIGTIQKKDVNSIGKDFSAPEGWNK